MMRAGVLGERGLFTSRKKKAKLFSNRQIINDYRSITYVGAPTYLLWANRGQGYINSAPAVLLAGSGLQHLLMLRFNLQY